MNTFLFLFSFVVLIAVGSSRTSSQNYKIHKFHNNFKATKVLGGSLPKDARIFGGSAASEGQFPYMVFFLYSREKDLLRGASSCSAALVKPDWVLLAVHCFDGGEPVKEGVIFVAGKADLNDYRRSRFAIPFDQTVDESQLGLQERRALELYLNPQYSRQDQTNDVALVKVQTAFQLNQNVQPRSLSQEEMKTKTACTIVGWGLTEGNERTYKLVYKDGVNALSVTEGCKYKDQGHFICLEKSKSGICQGDSGSPLICNNRIWGVASHLVSQEEQPDCGDDFEEYYAELYYNLDWMDEVLKIVSVDSGKDEGSGTGDKGSGAQIISSVFLLTLSLLAHC